MLELIDSFCTGGVFMEINALQFNRMKPGYNQKLHSSLYYRQTECNQRISANFRIIPIEIDFLTKIKAHIQSFWVV